MLGFSTGIAVAFCHCEMSRISPLLLAALLALTPVMGAVCAEGCHKPEVAGQVQVAAECEHGDAPEGSPLLTDIACAAERADLVPAEIKATDSTLAPSPGPVQVAIAPARVAVLGRCLQYHPPPVSSGAVLRI